MVKNISLYPQDTLLNTDRVNKKETLSDFYIKVKQFNSGNRNNI